MKFVNSEKNSFSLFILKLSPLGHFVVLEIWNLLSRSIVAEPLVTDYVEAFLNHCRFVHLKWLALGVAAVFSIDAVYHKECVLFLINVQAGTKHKLSNLEFNCRHTHHCNGFNTKQQGRTGSTLLCEMFKKIWSDRLRTL